MDEGPMFLDMSAGPEGFQLAPPPVTASDEDGNGCLGQSRAVPQSYASGSRQSAGTGTESAARPTGLSSAEAAASESLADDAGLALAARTLELSLEAEDPAALASTPPRSAEECETLTGLASAKVLRTLKPASTLTSRAAPLSRRSNSSRNSSCPDLAGYQDELPLNNEAALISALGLASSALQARGIAAAHEAREALLRVEGLRLPERLPEDAAAALGAARRILDAARAHAPLAATVAVHLARWSAHEPNAPLLCAGDGLEALLAALPHAPTAVRGPACAALANLCALPQGAALLSEVTTLERLCAAVREHLRAAGGARAEQEERERACANVLRGLKKLALSAEGRAALAESGALQLVVEAARALPASCSVVEQALRAVGNVAVEPEREAALLAAGCVQLLCDHLAGAEPAVLAASSGALANLVSNPAVRCALVDHGCAAQICALVRGPIAAASPELYRHTSWLLTTLAVEHESRAHVLAAGGYELLVAHCSRPCLQSQEEGAWALANLSADVRHALPIARAGALGVLFELVGSDSPSVQLQATWVFANLSVVDELKRTIGGQPGFIAALCTRLGSSAEEGDALRPLRLQTVRTLANLAVEPSNRAALGAHLPAAAAALGSSSDLELTQASLRLLVNLSYDPPIRAAMLALPELVGALLRSCASPAEAIQHEAVLCVVNLTLDEGAEPVLIAAGALLPLVAILRSGSAGLQEQAAWALSNVTAGSEAKVRAIELGALRALKALHRGSSGQMRQASTKVMHSLLSMVTPQSRKVFLPTPCSGSRDSNHGRSPLVDGARSARAAVLNNLSDPPE